MLGSPALWCLLSALLFGAATPASKAMLEGVGPLSLAGLLYVGAAVGVVPFSLRGGSPARWRSAQNVRRLVGAVFFGGVVGPVAVLSGLAQAPAASTSMWLNLEGIATAFIGWLVFREHLGLRIWAAALLVLAASTLLASAGSFSMAPAALLVFVGCVAWAIDNNLTSLIDGVTPAQSTLVKGVVAGLVNLLLAWWAGETMPSPSSVVTALALGSVSYGLSIVLYITGAQHLGATRSQLLFSTAPFLGVLLSWIVLGEAATTGQLAALGLLVVAVMLMSGSAHAHAHEHHALQHTHLHCHSDGHHCHEHDGLPPDAWHTHDHHHVPARHDHPHQPDLHHRHAH